LWRLELMAFVTARIDLVRPTAGARFRRVTLESEAGGAVVVRSLEAIRTPEAGFGFDDEELEFRVAPEDLPRFAMAAARALFEARPDAVERFRALCDESEIAIQTKRWT
jgi:hypothetical protein